MIINKNIFIPHNIKRGKINYDIQVTKPAQNLFYENSALKLSANYNMAFCSGEKPAYVINSTGEIKKFECLKAAKNYVSPDKEVSVKSHSKTRVIQGEYCIVPASIIERLNEKGELEIDTDKLKKYIQLIRREYVYAIKEDGSYKLYKTKAQAGRSTGAIKSVYTDINKGFCSNGNIFIHANDVEIIDEDGKIRIDSSKIEALSKKVTKGCNYYLIKSDGSYIKFDKQEEIAKHLNSEQRTIARVLSTNSIHQDCKIVYAQDVEKFDEDGNIEINLDKIKEIANDIRENNNRIFYAISDEGDCKKYTNKKLAQEELGIDEALISSCIRKARKKIENYTFVQYSEIETPNEDGTHTINQAKIDEIVKDLRKNYIYLIDKNGNYKIYKNQTELANELNVTRSYINLLLTKGNRYVKNIQKYIYRAGEIEIQDKDGKFIPDLEKIK